MTHIFQNKDQSLNLPIVLWAGWLHDLHLPWKKNAEKFSADEAQVFLQNLGAKQSFIDQVKHLIRFTANHSNASTAEERLLADADLKILGSQHSDYELYCDQVRQEYSHIPKFLFNRGRRRFLTGLLNQINKRGRLTYSLDSGWEKQAKSNIERELNKLEGHTT